MDECVSEGGLMNGDVVCSNLIPHMTPFDEAIPDEIGTQRVNAPLGPAVCRFRVTVFYVIAASPVNARVCDVYVTVIHVALRDAALFIRAAASDGYLARRVRFRGKSYETVSVNVGTQWPVTCHTSVDTQIELETVNRHRFGQVSLDDTLLRTGEDDRIAGDADSASARSGNGFDDIETPSESGHVLSQSHAIFGQQKTLWHESEFGGMAFLHGSVIATESILPSEFAGSRKVIDALKSGNRNRRRRVVASYILSPVHSFKHFGRRCDAPEDIPFRRRLGHAEARFEKRQTDRGTCHAGEMHEEFFAAVGNETALFFL